MALITRFVDGLILRGSVLKRDDLWVQEGKVIEPGEHADLTIDATNEIIAPGFIDLQINGCLGVDFTKSPEKIDQVAPFLFSKGVTGFLATLVSSGPETYTKALSTRHTVPGFLGFHLEGPFLNPLFPGAHNPHNFQTDCEALFNYYGDLSYVKMVTLAPELANASASIKKLSQLGILVSAGHTNANFDQLQDIRAVTHLYNAMRPFHHRDPGIVGKTLTSPQIAYGIIADGLHVHPAAIQIAWKSNPRGLYLISDAMEGSGLKEGMYILGEQTVSVNNGMAVVENQNKLAGSLITLDQAVRNFYKWTQCSSAEALEAASLKPAQLLNLKNKGHLNIGADADFVILNPLLMVQATYINGKKVF